MHIHVHVCILRFVGTLRGWLAGVLQLMMPALEGYCACFLSSRLDTPCAVAFLREAVRHSLHDVHDACVALVAQGAR